jgi:hypothetical protein
MLSARRDTPAHTNIDYKKAIDYIRYYGYETIVRLVPEETAHPYTNPSSFEIYGARDAFANNRQLRDWCNRMLPPEITEHITVFKVTRLQ